MRILILLLLCLARSTVATSGEATSWPVRYLPTLLEGSAHSPPLIAADVNLQYYGGSVQVAPKIYLVFWGWFGLDPAGEAPHLISFLSGVGGSPWAETLTQYDEMERGAITNLPGQLAGVWWDDALPIDGGLIVHQDNVQAEVQRAVNNFGYDRDANYVIAIPTLRNDPHFAVPGGFCAYHSRMTDKDLNEVAFTYFPYIPDAPLGACGENFVNEGAAGRLDGVTIVAGHEYAETITDPARGSGWLDAQGREIGDKCVWIRTGPGAAHNTQLSTGTFAVQTLWSNKAAACQEAE